MFTTIRTVGELRAALAGCGDDEPCLIDIEQPRSEHPDSFEDEYGPGFTSHFIFVNTGGPCGLRLNVDWETDTDTSAFNGTKGQ